MMQVNVIGGVVVCLGIAMTVWFGALNTRSAASELSQIIDQQISLQTEHSKLQKKIGSYALEWEQLKEQAERQGNLDTQDPPEVRLRTIRQMAEGHGWRNIGIMPVQWRRVADVAEQTFSVTAEAPYAQFLLFLRAFESSSIWADISHLAVSPLPKDHLDKPQQCRLEITLNFYSSFEPEAKTL